jgi:hypothetical protein
VKFPRQLARLPDQGVDHGPGVLARHFDEYELARVTLYQGRDLSVVVAKQQIPFPVPWRRTVLGFGRPFMDRDRNRNPTVIGALLDVVS